MTVDQLIAPWARPAPAFGGRRYTATDLALLPEDGWHYEVVEGLVVRMPPPQERRGFLEARLSAILFSYADANRLGRVYAGETGFDLTQPGERGATVLGADVAFLRADRVPGGDEDAYVSGAPDLVVEIASPLHYRPEMGAKAWLWLLRGARLVWVVWPRRLEVDVWTPGIDVPVTLHPGDALDGGDVLPGFTHALVDLFA